MDVKAEDIKAKLKQIYPEIDEYGLNFEVHFDQQKNAWIASFTSGKHTLSTHIEEDEVENCLLGKECYHLGIHLGRFIRHFCEGGGACMLGKQK